MGKGHGTVEVRAVTPVFGEVLSLLTYVVNRWVALMKPSRRVCLAWMRPDSWPGRGDRPRDDTGPFGRRACHASSDACHWSVFWQFRCGRAASLAGT
jgi:hypothetical protein